MITITISNTNTISIAIAIITISPGPNAHPFTNNGWEAGSRLCWKIWVGDLLSPRFDCLPFLHYLWYCNCQHHDQEASWDHVVVALKIRLRLWYWQTLWFWPPYTARHPPPATCHAPITARPNHCPPHATCLTLPCAWRLQLTKPLDRACPGVYLRTYSEVYLGAYLECTWEHLERLLGSV